MPKGFASIMAIMDVKNLAICPVSLVSHARPRVHLG